MGKPAIGFGGGEVSDEALDEAVKKAFSPEFRNRLDAVIKFKRLSKEIMESIVCKEISLISRRLEEKNVILSVSKNVVSFLAEKSYSPEFGARNVSRVVEDEIAAPLVDDVLFGRLERGGTVSFNMKNGKIALTIKSSGSGIDGQNESVESREYETEPSEIG